MKKLLVKIVTILLAFLAGAGFMSYATYMGNRDMTAVMAGATLPVAYVRQDNRLYNEMHGYVKPIDASYHKESVIGIMEEHTLSLAVEKYNAHIRGISYEVRSLDMSRLIEKGEQLSYEDDGTYLTVTLQLKDLLERWERYLLLLKVETQEHGEVMFYAQISYLGENHVKECTAFAEDFHRRTLEKDQSLYEYLEVDGSMDGKNLGYVNIHSNSGPVTWGEMPLEQVTDTEITYTDFYGERVSLVLRYQLRNTDTKETYQVVEAFCLQYGTSRIALLAYERTAQRIFTVGGQLLEDGQISFGIQGKELNYRKNDEEDVIGFVQQGQLYSFDFGQNRLSLVYGFQDDDDKRGLYQAHDFRIMDVEDSGSMDFLVYGYMNRGQYEGQCGILLCHYDALLNTVEEQFFLPSDHPYEVLKEEIGKLAVENETGTAWLSYRGMILQVDLKDRFVQILAKDILEERLQVSDSGLLAAWTEEGEKSISLLNTRNGIINQITTESGEILQALGFMEEDFIYGTAYQQDIRTDLAGRRIVPLHRVVIRDKRGSEVREFDYASKGKYVTGVTIVENRIDLTCIALREDGSYQEVLPEPITYTSEPAKEKLSIRVANDKVKRDEYHLIYEGTIKSGSMKRPKVKLVLFEDNRTLALEDGGANYWFAWIFTGEAKGFNTLAEAINYAYDGRGTDDGMGSVWKDGSKRYWQKWRRQTRAQIEGFLGAETAEPTGSSLAQCLQLLLRQKQLYTDVETKLNEGQAVWEILSEELSESSCLLPGCNLRSTLYYVDRGAPVMGITESGEAVLMVGYDAQNIIYYEPGQTTLSRAGLKDATEMFEAAGNLFFTYLP